MKSKGIFVSITSPIITKLPCTLQISPYYYLYDYIIDNSASNLGLFDAWIVIYVKVSKTTRSITISIHVYNIS